MPLPIANADFVNGKFSLELPQHIPSNMLLPMTTVMHHGPKYASSTLTITPSSANGVIVHFTAKDDAFRPLGTFRLKGTTNDEDGAFYIYVDRNVEITGTVDYTLLTNGYDYEDIYDDISLSEGWNLIYHKLVFTEGTGGSNNKYTVIYSSRKMSVKWAYDSYL